MENGTNWLKPVLLPVNSRPIGIQENTVRTSRGRLDLTHRKHGVLINQYEFEHGLMALYALMEFRGVCKGTGHLESGGIENGEDGDKNIL
jgi:hypothetical protein